MSDRHMFFFLIYKIGDCSLNNIFNSRDFFNNWVDGLSRKQSFNVKTCPNNITLVLYEFIAISITIIIIIIIIIITIIIIDIIMIIIINIIIIIDHVCYKTWFGGESISVLFETHCLPLLIGSDLIGKPY